MSCGYEDYKDYKKITTIILKITYLHVHCEDKGKITTITWDYNKLQGLHEY